MTEIQIDQIDVGKRYRQDYGDIESLMESIREHGLLSPITLVPGNTLLCGGRRLEACKRLGWSSIPFQMAADREDAIAFIKAERAENTERKDMTPSELMAIAAEIEKLEAPKARERMSEGGQRGSSTTNHGRWGVEVLYFVGTSTEPDSEPAWRRETRTKVAEAVGLSSAQYQRAKKVIGVADGTVPAAPEARAVAKEAQADMDAGKATINRAYDRVRNALDPKPKPEPATPPRPTKPGPKVRHLDSLDRVSNTIAGIAMATKNITELDSSVTQEEAARLTDGLSESIRELKRINSLLKGKATP